MITIESSIPRKSEKYLKAIDIFYTQFNDINFYFEDSGKENYYLKILQKLYPEKKITKVFGLSGKKSIIDECRKNVNSKNQIYVLDKDFDDILERKIDLANLFYLERYSIENFLLEEDAFIEFIIEQKPTLRKTAIERNFKIKNSLKDISLILKELTSYYILAQKNKLEIKSCKISPERFCKSERRFVIDGDKVIAYKEQVKIALKNKDKRLTIKGQLKKLKIQPRAILDFIITHCPGKYLLYFLKEKIQHVFGLISVNMDSFIFRLIKNSQLTSLNSLKESINAFIIVE